MLLIPLALTVVVSLLDYVKHGDMTNKSMLVSIAIWTEYLMIALADVCLGW